MLRSELGEEPPLVRLELPELLHEALVRLRLLPLRQAKLERVVHAQAEAAHGVHDEGGGAAGFAHRAVHKDSILLRCDFSTLLPKRVVMLHDSAVLKFLLAHLQLVRVRLVVQQHGGRRVGICHAGEVNVVHFDFLVARRLCVGEDEVVDLLEHILNWLVLLVGHDQLQISQVRCHKGS